MPIFYKFLLECLIAWQVKCYKQCEFCTNYMVFFVEIKGCIWAFCVLLCRQTDIFHSEDYSRIVCDAMADCLFCAV